MKTFNYLIIACILFVSAYSNSYAQKTESVEKDWSVGIGGKYVLHDSDEDYSIQDATGAYFNIEKIWNDNFGFSCSLDYLRSKKTEYINKENVPNYYDIFGLNKGKFNSQIYVYALSLGATWYIVSNDIANDFCPYVSTSVLIESSDIKYTSADNTQKTIVTDNILNFAILPAVGINVPTIANFSLHLEVRYNISICYIMHQEDIKQDYNYITVNMGLKYSF